MGTEFRLPNLGEQVKSGDLIRILVSVGDRITEEQAVLEMETDKADFEVPSDVSGTVREIHVKEGDTVDVGQLIFTLDGGGGKEERKPETGKGEKQEVEEKEGKEPAKQSGKKAAGEETETRPSGKESTEKRKEKRDEGKTGHEGEGGDEGVPEEENETGRAAEEVPLEEEKKTEDRQKREEIIPAGPSVRRLARELGIDLNEVGGSGPQGRISAEDVKSHARRMLEKAPQTASPAGMLPDFSRWGKIERKPMSRIRRQTARNMSFSWSSIPHVTHFDRADITELDGLRNRFKESVAEAGGKLSLTAIAIKVAASALKLFPKFRSSVDAAGEEIIVKDYFHIGVAVDTDRGLLVPVIRDADRKNIHEISVELSRLAEKARNRKIRPEDMEGGVFTVTNLGGIGGTQFSPIVYAPQVAILGISRAAGEPVFVDGQLETRLVLPLSLSYDHRIIDGADAARFLRWVAEALEQPFILSLKG